MQRILYLSRGGDIGGSQRQLNYVISNLDRNLYKPIVVCRKDGSFTEQLRNARIETYVFPLHSWRKFPACLCRYSDAMRLTKFARCREVSLIHSSDLWLNGYLAWVAGKLNIPSVLHMRTPIRQGDVHKHRCVKASSIIAISQRVMQNLLSAGIGPEKISLIDDAVDINIFKPQTRKENVLKRDFFPIANVMVGIVGRIDKFKRQLAFLKAAKKIIRNSTKNVSFFIIGDIHSQSYFEKLKRFISKNRLSRHVFFAGRRQDMPQVLTSLDILVSLSGGSVMFEAMSCGKAVISAGFSTEKNSVHIRNKHTGILIPSKETADLVQAISKLINSPQLRKQLGRQARIWAENHFSHTIMAYKTQRLYEQLLSPKYYQEPVPEPAMANLQSEPEEALAIGAARAG